MRSPHLKMARAAMLALVGALVFSALTLVDRAQAHEPAPGVSIAAELR